MAGLSLAFVSIGQPSAIAGDYLLGPQDKVRLKIYEWRASRDVIFEWTALNDQFTVGAGGALSLPFVGDIQAAGVTPSDLAGAIGDRLMRQMGLGRQPDVAVEVVQYRPFYIVGHVTQPGEFPYRPGLTVLQALTIAGGLRTREENFSRLEREVIAGRGEVSVLALNNVSLMARKARLEAELAGLDKIAFPEQLAKRQGEATIGVIMAQESSIFETRREALNTQVRALTDLKEFLQKELSSLEAQLALHDKQIELMEKELGGVSSLVNKGFAAGTRELALQRTLADIQSGRLSAETSLLRARQEVSRTDISILELRNTRTNEITVSLRETQAQLEELNRKADTAVELLHESEFTAPRLLALRADAAKAQPIYTIVRPSGNDTVELPAKESTPVEPGDTVKVEIPMPPALEGFDETSGLSLPDASIDKEVSVAPEQSTGIQ
jgi:polysaccharide export outer membrane protein/exopolysaccharide production protein ExoF